MTSSGFEDWSQKYYPGLPDYQHKANNEWFARALSLLTPDGFLHVPNLGISFDKQGNEIEHKQ